MHWQKLMILMCAKEPDVKIIQNIHYKVTCQAADGL